MSVRTAFAASALRILAFAWILALVSVLTGCACSSEAHRNDTVCVIAHDIVDCTESGVIAVAPQFLPVVLALVNQLTGGDGSVDWASVEASLLSLGLRDGGCILAELESQFASKPQVTPRSAAQAKGYQAWFAGFRSRHFPAGVKFRLPGGELR